MSENATQETSVAVSGGNDGDIGQAGLLCPNCLSDVGLHRMAGEMKAETGDCPRCASSDVPVLTREDLLFLVKMFFVHGSLERADFGGAPVIQFNDSQPGSLGLAGALGRDVDLLQSTLGIGLFHYGPNLWMLGYIEPLQELCDEGTRDSAIARILDAYPVVQLEPGTPFYRVRKAPHTPSDPAEYDAPPKEFAGKGRLDSTDCAILYGSQDLEVCVHECRFAAEDELYVATLTPLRKLKLLDLSALIDEQCSEFESVDLAVHMLFLAGAHSYPVSRALADAARRRGFDGLCYPSFFSLLRTGSIPFETAFGISLRKFAQMREYELSKMVPNIALFGQPIAAGDVQAVGINRLRINQVRYHFSFGPADYNNEVP
ncbi:RES family NAD+ phosphorylase [Novosphingobium mangrovi (ex Huang et al. 2023)]|uniref:RES family NAD+ phosphorylase n=1 Tax=Novosphingobium mangrovi (ex Huang et al. 2023) TaxID=2976432 RepID=A0ABT2I7A3_9SPHN|nr:RES family NAD+ phosphorylase [Novosphingobium mangrovi (ex Huang et al. 2023)]MCT2400422.1 RES family NAD+ phosphorylase [Novosphingobium mangrovi (ex Huang et al. 2023)]